MCVLTTEIRVADSQRYEECVLTDAKRVGGLQRFGECVFTTEKRVGCLQSYEECILLIAKFFRRPADVRRVCFERSKASRRLAAL